MPCINMCSCLGLLLVFGCQLWYKLHRSLGSCVVCDTLGVTRLRIVAPQAYHIRQSFLGVYLSRIPRFGIPIEACEKVAVDLGLCGCFRRVLRFSSTTYGPALMAVWSKALRLTSSYLSTLSWFEFHPHVRKLPLTLGLGGCFRQLFRFSSKAGDDLDALWQKKVAKIEIPNLSRIPVEPTCLCRTPKSRALSSRTIPTGH